MTSTSREASKKRIRLLERLRRGFPEFLALERKKQKKNKEEEKEKKRSKEKEAMFTPHQRREPWGNGPYLRCRFVFYGGEKQSNVHLSTGKVPWAAPKREWV